MKIDFNVNFKNVDGNDYEEKGNKITIKEVCINSLLAMFPNEVTEGEEKLRRWNLAKKVSENLGDYTTEELALIKQLVGKIYSPLFVGQAYELIEGKNKTEEKKK